jgi:hypothetical protein
LNLGYLQLSPFFEIFKISKFWVKTAKARGSKGLTAGSKVQIPPEVPSYYFHCTTQPRGNSNLEIKPKVHQNLLQKSNQVPTSYNPMEVEGSHILLPTLYKQWLEAEISNRQDSRDGRG